MFRPSLDEAYRKRQKEDDRLISPSFLAWILINDWNEILDYRIINEDP